MNKCPKCAADMERGYVPEADYTVERLTQWFQGAPKVLKSFGFIPFGINVNRRKGGLPMAAFRCSACGFVEWYARDEFEST